MEDNPFFSILVLCWNSNRTIVRCLDALQSQTCQDFEIILVDNGSPEPVPTDLPNQYPDLSIQFLTLEKNLGFCGGNNFAAQYATGSYLVLLNADAFPTPEWLASVREASEQYPDSFFASKLIKSDQPDRLDGEGDVYHFTGLIWRRSYNSLQSNAADRVEEVFGACAAAAVYPLKAFLQVNGFDADYFSYAEDMDLSFRLRLVGYTCIYLPDAVVYHVGSGSTQIRSDLSVYYGQRNLVWTYFKDVPGVFMWLLSPIHIITNLFTILLGVFRGQTRITIKAKLDAVRGLPVILRKRKLIQRTRTVPSRKILESFDWNLFSPINKLLHN